VRKSTQGDAVRHLEALFDLSAIGMAVVSPSGEPLICNEALAGMLGRTVEELVGLNFTEFTYSPDLALELPLFEQILGGEIDRYEIDKHYLHRDGSLVPVRVWLAALRDRSTDELQSFVALVENLAEREQAAEALRLADERLRLAADAARIGIWDWDIAGDRLVWDDRMFEQYGLDPRTAISFDAWRQTLSPDDQERTVALVEATLAGDGEWAEQFGVVRPDGTRRLMQGRGHVFRDADGTPVRMAGISIDVTEQRHAESALRETSALLARAQQIARLGSYAVDFATNRTTWSTELVQLIGLGEDVLESGPELFWSLVHPDDRERLGAQMPLDDLEAAAGIGHEFRVRRPDGSVIWVRTVFEVETDGEGTVQRLIGVLQDITEQRQLEAQLRRSERLEAVGQLAGGIAHDFNNLLAVVSGNAQMALREQDPERLAAKLGDVLRASEQAADLVRRLLDFSRGHEDEPPQLVDVNATLTSARRMLRRVLGVEIGVGVELAEGDPHVLLVAGALEQVLLNLALNARDAMPDGGELTIGASVAADQVVLTVRDSGGGIDETTLKRIFDPFFTTKPLGEGTGLGLSTVYGIVHGAEGTVEADSEPGRGTTMTIRLPLAAVPEAGAEREHPLEAVAGRGERVLLVDDEDMVRAVGQDMLASVGYTVETAADGAEALELLERNGASFDLVLADVRMPGMDGRALAHELRARGIEIPVVFTSGYVDQTQLPAGRVLEKPYSLRRLSETVAEALAAQPRRV
jgi:PAS domain S-box-containing protein